MEVFSPFNLKNLNFQRMENNWNKSTVELDSIL